MTIFTDDQQLIVTSLPKRKKYTLCCWFHHFCSVWNIWIELWKVILDDQHFFGVFQLCQKMKISFDLVGNMKFVYLLWALVSNFRSSSLTLAESSKFWVSFANRSAKHLYQFSNVEFEVRIAWAKRTNCYSFYTLNVTTCFKWLQRLLQQYLKCLFRNAKLSIFVKQQKQKHSTKTLPIKRKSKMNSVGLALFTKSDEI